MHARISSRIPTISPEARQHLRRFALRGVIDSATFNLYSSGRLAGFSVIGGRAAAACLHSFRESFLTGYRVIVYGLAWVVGDLSLVSAT